MDLRKMLHLDYWGHFIKFNIVGLMGVVINEGLLLALVAAGVYLLYADSVAIEISILSNFVLNDLWTFRDRRHGHVAVRLVKFNGLMLIGLAANLAILYFFTDYLGVHYAVSNLIGIGAAFLLRYWLSVKFAWIKKDEESAEPPPQVRPPLPRPSRPSDGWVCRLARPLPTPPPHSSPRGVRPSVP